MKLLLLKLLLLKLSSKTFFDAATTVITFVQILKNYLKIFNWIVIKIRFTLLLNWRKKGKCFIKFVDGQHVYLNRQHVHVHLIKVKSELTLRLLDIKIYPFENISDPQIWGIFGNLNIYWKDFFWESHKISQSQICEKLINCGINKRLVGLGCLDYSDVKTNILHFLKTFEKNMTVYYSHVKVLTQWCRMDGFVIIIECHLNFFVT